MRCDCGRLIRDWQPGDYPACTKHLDEYEEASKSTPAAMRAYKMRRSEEKPLAITPENYSDEQKRINRK